MGLFSKKSDDDDPTLPASFRAIRKARAREEARKAAMERRYEGTLRRAKEAPERSKGWF